MSKHIVIDARIRRASTGRPVDRLLEQLQDLDNVNRYTILLEPDDPWEPRAVNFYVKYCKYRQFSLNPLQQITFAWQLYWLRPHLVHFTLSGQQPMLYLGPQVTFTHDLTMYEYARAGRLPMWLHKLRMAGYRLIMWSSHRMAERVIVPTEYVKKAVGKLHPFTKDKVTVTLEASEPPRSQKAQKPKFAPESFILCVGTAFPHKNLEGVVDAFGLLAPKNPKLKLVLVGKKEYFYEKLDEYIATKSYADRVLTPGFVTDSELRWLYEHAQVYVFASLSEGFGLPGLEAMVHGCPVVSSNATCLPEVYGDAAHYFDPKDVGEMAISIQVVLSDKKFRTQLIKRGHQQVKKYSWQRFSEQTHAIYEQILS